MYRTCGVPVSKFPWQQSTCTIRDLVLSVLWPSLSYIRDGPRFGEETIGGGTEGQNTALLGPFKELV